MSFFNLGRTKIIITTTHRLLIKKNTTRKKKQEVQSVMHGKDLLDSSILSLCIHNLINDKI